MHMSSRDLSPAVLLGQVHCNMVHLDMTAASHVWLFDMRGLWRGPLRHCVYCRP